MEDLIKALEIFKKYLKNPNDKIINCTHDEMGVCLDPDLVSIEDKKILETLGFLAEENEGYFFSYRYGSC